MSDNRRARGRANGEGSIYPYKNGYAAYVWVTTPDGEKKRKYVYGKDRDETHGKWLKLHAAAKAGPVVTKSQTLGEYLAYWLKDVVTEPDYAPLTIATYRGMLGYTLFPDWESTNLTSSVSGMYDCGLTTYASNANAARREKTPTDQRKSNDAAQWGSAANPRCRSAQHKTSSRFCAPR